MNLASVNQYFGNIDIYLLDQILKNRFRPNMKVLDAGCGEGRNLVYFLNSGYRTYGLDTSPEAIKAVRFIASSINPEIDSKNFCVGDISDLPYANDFFELVIASAVLHFAPSRSGFMTMFDELIRCLKPGGMLFVRMTSDIGIEEKVVAKGSGQYSLPDGTHRFLLTRDLLAQLQKKHHFEYLEPLKTVNVNDIRCMTTLVLTIT